MRDFERSLPMMLYRALDTVMPQFRSMFARFGLTEPQWRVLRLLWQADGQTVSALARPTLIDPPVLVGIIDRLERDGLVTRRRSRTDRRRVHVHLTERGRRLEADVQPLVEQAYERFERALPQRQWDALYEALDTLSANVEPAGPDDPDDPDDRTPADPGPAEPEPVNSVKEPRS